MCVPLGSPGKDCDLAMRETLADWLLAPATRRDPAAEKWLSDLLFAWFDAKFFKSLIHVSNHENVDSIQKSQGRREFPNLMVQESAGNLPCCVFLRTLHPFNFTAFLSLISVVLVYT